VFGGTLKKKWDREYAREGGREREGEIAREKSTNEGE